MADNDLKVIIKAKELARHSFKLTSNSNRFPKKYRHSLGDRIQLTSLDIYTTLTEANRINNKTARNLRCDTITKAIKHCDDLLFFIELSMNLELLFDYLKIIIRDQPTVDAVEVVHGRWRPVDHDGSWRVDMCSVCHRRMHYVDYDQPYQYCPNCGAKMDGDGNG